MNAENMERDELIAENVYLNESVEDLEEKILGLECELDDQYLEIVELEDQIDRYQQIFDLIGIRNISIGNLSLKKAMLIKDKFEELNL